MIWVKSPADELIIKMGNTNWCLFWVCDSDVWANCPCIRLPSPSLRLFSSSRRKIWCQKNILNIHIVSVSSVFISIWFVYGCVQVCPCADCSYHLFPCDDAAQPPTLRYKQTLLTRDTHDAMSLTEHTQTRIIEEHWKKHTHNVKWNSYHIFSLHLLYSAFRSQM